MEWFSPQQIHLAMFEFCSGVLHFFDFSVSLNWISPRSGLDVRLDRTGASIFVANVFAFERFTSPTGVSVECLKACKDDTGLHAIRASIRCMKQTHESLDSPVSIQLLREVAVP